MHDLLRRVSDSLKHVHNHGAQLYNRGQHAEAYRLYQGALFVTLQMLTSRPDLKLIIADGLSEVERSAANDQLKAFRLHEVIDHMRSQLKVPVNGELAATSAKVGDSGKL
jgi:hypothetical protein